MTHEEFIQWLDERIEFYAPDAKHSDYALAKVSAFREVKDKFLKLLPPPTTLS